MSQRSSNFLRQSAAQHRCSDIGHTCSAILLSEEHKAKGKAIRDREEHPPTHYRNQGRAPDYGARAPQCTSSFYVALHTKAYYQEIITAIRRKGPPAVGRSIRSHATPVLGMQSRHHSSLMHSHPLRT